MTPIRVWPSFLLCDIVRNRTRVGLLAALLPLLLRCGFVSLRWPPRTQDGMTAAVKECLAIGRAGSPLRIHAVSLVVGRKLVTLTIAQKRSRRTAAAATPPRLFFAPLR